MKPFLMILCVMLVGCGINILPHEIVKAQEFCKDHGGIQEVSKNVLIFNQGVHLWTRCIDGTYEGLK